VGPWLSRKALKFDFCWLSGPARGGWTFGVHFSLPSWKGGHPLARQLRQMGQRFDSTAFSKDGVMLQYDQRFPLA
jgi:hypothetical protein